MKVSCPVILASQSPRRQQLLHQLFSDFTVLPSHAEETTPLPDGIEPQEVSEYLSRLKASDIAASHPEALVIGADTTVLLKEQGQWTILGKPANADDARGMLRRLSGKTHQVVTGCALCHGGDILSFSSVSKVTFYPLSEEEIDAYIKSGEPMDKAGAYGIQYLGSLLVEKIEGDYFTVVGLPVALLARKILLLPGFEGSALFS